MEQFISRFKVPSVALPVIEQIVNAEEIQLIEALDNESFTAESALSALKKYTGEKWPEERIHTLLSSAYKRGIISLEDESFTRFKISSFYGRLDMFAITESDKYLSFDHSMKKSLDEWYFDAYLKGLGDNPQPSDKVVTLNEAIDFIDTVDRPIWLNRCDCRTLAGNCDKPVDTCISFRNGINTMSHRGWSKPIDKAQAKEIVKRANSEGLMQTVNPNGMCNCCGDCCYLFRAQKARGNNLVWPASENIAHFDSDACITCGLCTERCHFNAFELNSDGLIEYYPERCRGCGLCNETCPTSAITMIRQSN
jgi:Pyruvate/2-oxoacid:ferredoxin oxidoreductase delta subunit